MGPIALALWLISLAALLVYPLVRRPFPRGGEHPTRVDLVFAAGVAVVVTTWLIALAKNI